MDRDPDSLYRGAALPLAEDWVARAHPRLTGTEQEFLAAARSSRDSWRRNRRRRGRILTGALATVALVVGTLAAVAVREARSADVTRRLAVHRQLVVAARAQLDRDPQLAFLLARQAYAERPDAAAEAVLRQATSTWRGLSSRQVFDRRVSSAGMSPDGRFVIGLTTGQGPARVEVWDGAAPAGRPVVLPGSTPRAYSVMVSADGRRAAASHLDGTVQVWDLTRSPVPPPQLLAGHSGAVRPLRFSPDGRLLASADESGAVWVWTLGDRPTSRRLPDPARGPGYGVAFSTDGGLVIGATDSGPPRVWSLAEPDRAPRTLTGAGTDAELVLSSDGSRLALSRGGTLQVVSTSGGEPVSVGRLRDSFPAAFSLDARRLATANPYGVIGI